MNQTILIVSKFVALNSHSHYDHIGDTFYPSPLYSHIAGSSFDDYAETDGNRQYQFEGFSIITAGAADITAGAAADESAE